MCIKSSDLGGPVAWCQASHVVHHLLAWFKLSRGSNTSPVFPSLFTKKQDIFPSRFHGRTKNLRHGTPTPRGVSWDRRCGFALPGGLLDEVFIGDQTLGSRGRGGERWWKRLEGRIFAVENTLAVEQEDAAPWLVDVIRWVHGCLQEVQMNCSYPVLVAVLESIFWSWPSLVAWDVVLDGYPAFLRKHTTTTKTQSNTFKRHLKPPQKQQSHRNSHLESYKNDEKWCHHL